MPTDKYKKSARRRPTPKHRQTSSPPVCETGATPPPPKRHFEWKIPENARVRGFSNHPEVFW